MTTPHTSMWRPIVSAPRDKSVILLRRKSDVMVGFYYDSGDSYPWVTLDPGVKSGINGWMDNEHGPTHWRAMPDFLSDEQNLTSGETR